MLHAKLAPSSAARRIACPGSRALEELYPETQESPASREGTAAHWVAQQLLLCNYNLPLSAPNGEPITKEMLEGGDLYVYEINQVTHDIKSMHIEERIDISIIHPECWGTPDCWTVKDGHLHIWDYKFGHGFVDAFENWQLIEYAAGICEVVPVNEITMHIVQPRNYHRDGPVRSWTITAALMESYIQTLQYQETAAMQPDAQCHPNPECNHCLGRHACTSLQNAALTSVDVSNSNSPWELSALSTGNELRYLKRAAQLLDARITGLSEQAKSMITRGEFVPGFKLESSAGRERWTKEISEILMLGEMLGLDLSKPAEVVTPAQARKLGIDDCLLHEYSQRVPGALKLVEYQDARKEFGK